MLNVEDLTIEDRRRGADTKRGLWWCSGPKAGARLGVHGLEIGLTACGVGNAVGYRRWVSRGVIGARRLGHPGLEAVGAGAAVLVESVEPVAGARKALTDRDRLHPRLGDPGHTRAAGRRDNRQCRCSVTRSGVPQRGV